ncbi:MAG: choice-of-anchor J domain-containing protein [Paludibacteraceae bacterium]|nr:choice-of-anchor J domain-containing protein [Paludibacteraceae bacterium]
MRRIFTRSLFMMLMILGAATVWAQKSVLDENFANGKPADWTTAGSYWKFQNANALFEALVQDGVDTLFAPVVSLDELTNHPSVAITYSNVANADKKNTLKVLYRESEANTWSELQTFADATDGQVDWKGQLPDGLSNVQIALAGAYLGGAETRVYRLSIENKTEAAIAPSGLRYEDLTTSSITLWWEPCTSNMFIQYNIKVSTTALTDMSAEADVLDRVGWQYTDEWYELAGLNPNTQYYAYVQYDCGDGDVSPWAELVFSTPCISINAPFAENFEGELSSCFTIIKEGSAANVSTEYAHNSTKAFKSNSVKGKNNYLILPEFKGDLKNYQVAFMAAAVDGGNTYARSVTIGVCSDATAETFTSIKTLDLPRGRQWESIVVSLKGYAGSGKYVAFKLGNADKENRIFVDDIKIERASECPKPMFAEVMEINPNSAKLKWVETGNATEWNLVVSQRPLTDPEDIELDAVKGEFAGAISSNPYVISNLQANTTYYAYLQAGCGSSGWTNAIEFKTARAVTYPYHESFDRMDPASYTNDINAIPLGWVVDDRCIELGTNYDKQYTSEIYRPFVSTSQNHDASNYVNASLLLRGASSNGYMSIAMLPAMPKDVNQMMVTFWAKATNGNHELRIGVANTQTNDLVPGQQLGANITNVGSLIIKKDEWVRYRMSLKDYIGTGRYIVFSVGTVSGTPSIYIDDIEIDDIPDCSQVTQLTTIALGTNSVKATWVDGTGATSWKVKVSSTEINPEEADGDIANATVDSKEYTATGLSMGKTYYIYVSPSCEDMWQSATVTTLVGMNVPYYNDFTDETTGSGKGAPKFWTLGNAGGTTSASYIPYVNTTAWTATTGHTIPSEIVKNSLYFYAYKNNNANAYIPYAIMPELLNADVKDLSISFYGWTSSSLTNSHTLRIGVLTNPTDMATLTEVTSVTLEEQKVAQKYIVDMSSYTGSGKYIVFYINEGNKAGYFYLDNLEVSLTGGPVRVSDVAVLESSITRTGATATWTEKGTATKWNVRVFDSEQEDPSVGTPAFSAMVENISSIDISGLSSGTTYYVYVQSIVGSQGSAWNGSSFFTLCDPFPVPFVEDWESYGSGAGKLSGCYKDTATVKVGTYAAPNATEKTGNVIQLNPSSAGQVAMLVFPEMNQPINTLQLTMKASPFSSSYIGARSHTDIGVWDGTNFEKVAEYEFNLSDQKAWDECYVDFSSYVGSGTRIALRAAYATANNSINICFDNIRIEQIPLCKKITSVEISDIDSTSAAISWAKAGNEEAWNLKVSTTKLDNPGDATADIFEGKLTEMSKALTGLVGNTTYYVYVQAVDDALGCEGAWSNPKEFTTNCQLKTIPYIEDFESYNTGSGNLPGCSFICGQDANHSYVSTGAISHTNKTKMLYLRQVTKEHNNYFVFPELVIDSVKHLQMSMQVSTGATGSTSTYFYKVGVMTDPNDPGTFVEMFTDSIVGSPNPYDRVYKFDKYAGDESGLHYGKYIALQAVEYRSSTGSLFAGSVYIDNVSIDYIETCPAPYDLVADSVGVYGVKYIWKTEDKTIAHRIRLFTKADADPDNDAYVAEQILSDSVAIFERLNSNSVYYAYVRKECSSNDLSKWSSSALCHTNCAEVQSMPYVETFEGCTAGVVPNCWTNIGSYNATVTTTAKLDGANGLSITYSKPASQSGKPHQWAVLVSPALDVNSLKDVLLCFDAKASTTGGGGLRIDAVSDNTTNAEVIPITTIEDLSNTSWTKAYIKLGDYYTSAQPYKYLRFTPIDPSTSGRTIYVDNIVLTTDMSTAFPVASLQALKVNEHELTFSFVEQTPGIDAWKVAYVGAGENLADATIIDVDTTTVTLANLSLDTNYDIYVRSESSDWVGPLTMRTTKQVATIPYETGFEDDADNALWNIYNVQTVQGAFWPNYFIFGDATECGATGNKALYVTSDGHSYSYKLSSSTVWATRDIHFAEAGTYRLKFRVKAPGNAKEDEHDEMYIRLFPAGATFRLGANADVPVLLDGSTIGRSAVTNIAKNSFLLDSALQDIFEYENRMTTLDIVEPGVYTIAMLWKNAGTGTTIAPAAIDSVIVEEYLCTKPSKFEYSSRSAHSVGIKWFAGKCKDFEYVVSRYSNLGNPALIEEEDKVAFGTLSEGPQLNLTNLKACTNYSLYVRTVCPEGTTGWVEYDFLTACELEDLPYTESFNELPPCWTFINASLTSGNAGLSNSDYEEWSYIRLNPNGMVVLPELNSPLNKVGIEFAIFNIAANLGAVTLGVVENEWDVSSFEPIQIYGTKETPYSTGTYNDWHLEIFNKMLNMYQGNGRLLAIKNTGGSAIGIKYVKLAELAECIQPQDVEITYINANGATINWLGGTETAWEIKLNDSIIENISTNPYVLTGLTHGTTYQVAVRAICDATHTSEWSLPISFQTECAINALPLYEDFGSFPDCNNQTNKPAALPCWENLYSQNKIEKIFDGTATLSRPSKNTSWSRQWAPNAYGWGGDAQQLFFYGGNNAENRYRWMITPQYAIEGDATLSFDVRQIDNQGMSTQPEGRFFVAISTDNGATWQKANATEITDIDSVYTTKSVSLDKYAGQAIRVAFYMEDLGGKTTAGRGSGIFTFIDNVRMNCSETYPMADNACQGYDYEGNGFVIAKEDLPLAGKDSTYYRFAANTGSGCDSVVALTITTHKAATATVYETICAGETFDFGPYHLTDPNPVGTPYYITGETQYGCDSTIYLYLTVNPSDTIAIAPIEVDVNQLPYQVDELFTVPAGTPIGDLVEIVKVDACHFNRYAVTVKDLATGLIYVNSDVDHVDVYDILGRKIQTIVPQVGELQLHLPTGVYMLRTTMTDGQIATRKISIK